MTAPVRPGKLDEAERASEERMKKDEELAAKHYRDEDRVLTGREVGRYRREWRKAMELGIVQSELRDFDSGDQGNPDPDDE